MTTYYNYISVRDQLILAKKKSKCDFYWDIPKELKITRINDQWESTCPDPCTPGHCEVYLYISKPDKSNSIKVNLYYVKGHPIAYISFFSETVIENLIKRDVLKRDKLRIEKDAPNILSGTGNP